MRKPICEDLLLSPCVIGGVKKLLPGNRSVYARHCSIATTVAEYLFRTEDVRNFAVAINANDRQWNFLNNYSLGLLRSVKFVSMRGTALRVLDEWIRLKHMRSY
jgi:hypothetical protein